MSESVDEQAPLVELNVRGLVQLTPVLVTPVGGLTVAVLTAVCACAVDMAPSKIAPDKTTRCKIDLHVREFTSYPQRRRNMLRQRKLIC